MSNSTKSKRLCPSDTQKGSDYKTVVTVRNQGQRGTQRAAALAVYKLDPRVRGLLPLTTAGWGLPSSRFRARVGPARKVALLLRLRVACSGAVRSSVRLRLGSAVSYGCKRSHKRGATATKVARKEKPK